MSLKNRRSKGQMPQNIYHETIHGKFRNKRNLKRSPNSGFLWQKGGTLWKATRADFLESQRCSISSLGKWEDSYLTIVRIHQFMHRRPVCFITGKLYLNEIV